MGYESGLGFMVGWVGSAFGGLTSVDESGGAESGIASLQERQPVGNHPVPVLLVGHGCDALGNRLEVFSGHGFKPCDIVQVSLKAGEGSGWVEWHDESLPEHQRVVNPLGWWAGC